MPTKIRMNHSAMQALLDSAGVVGVLQDVAAPVASAMKSDPNPVYADSVTTTTHRSQGQRGRTSVRVGAAPGIGSAVEAKRGTAARALGSAGG